MAIKPFETTKKNFKVGEHIFDPTGHEWVVSNIWYWDDWTDYDLINTKTGESGGVRIPKDK